MGKKECKHEEWNPCGNDFYSCRKCGILRTSHQVNLYEEKDKKIADLEAKLAESEERCTKMWKWEVQQINRLQEENNQLNQQLSDKDKEVQQWKSMAERSSNLLDRFNITGEIGAQDKISFCIEQFEKVKKHISSGLAFDVDVQIWFEEYINNQIEELKKELNK